MDGADVVSAAGRRGGVGGVTEDDGIDLVRIVLLIGGWGGSGRSAGGTGGAGVARGEMSLPVLPQSIEDRGERSKGATVASRRAPGRSR